jgi:hypothetical protein
MRGDSGRPSASSARDRQEDVRVSGQSGRRLPQSRPDRLERRRLRSGYEVTRNMPSDAAHHHQGKRVKNRR